MPDPKRLTPKDLVVGGRYLHANGLFIRQIEAIEGGAVAYHDQYGQGRCGKGAFLKTCPMKASIADEAQPQQQLAHITRVTEGQFVLRDEANALTAFAFRNGFLENLHAGKHSTILDQQAGPTHFRLAQQQEARDMTVKADLWDKKSARRIANIIQFILYAS